MITALLDGQDSAVLQAEEEEDHISEGSDTQRS